MWKFIGGTSYLPGMPMADISESDWKDFPSADRETARKLKLYEHAPDEQTDAEKAAEKNPESAEPDNVPAPVPTHPSGMPADAVIDESAAQPAKGAK